MTGIVIRAACCADWPTIAEFNCRLAWESEEKRLDPAKIEPGVQAVLQDPAKGRYFVAEADGQVVGQLMYTMEWSDWRNGQIWWLQSVYVAAEYRQQGVFRQLFEHLVALGIEERVLGVRLYVEKENERAQRTYQQLGLAQPGYHVMERWFGPAL
ncbi:MAG: GNAT family N-acetyltransferase [Planctomycetota bacterium]